MPESYRMAVDSAAIFSETDARGRILHVNDMFCKISGYSRDELIGENHRILNSGFHPSTFFVEMWRAISSGEVWRGEICNRSKDGGIYWVYSTILPMTNKDTGEIYKYVSIRFDITEKKQLLHDLEWRAYHDVLTGLPNRALFAQRAKEACKESREGSLSCAICLLDLDYFKDVNDRYGHYIGDRLLVIIAERLKSTLHARDMASRVGGDEFALIMPNIRDEQDLSVKLLRILNGIAAPIYIEKIEIRISACVGVSLYPEDSSDVDGLLRHADSAMHLAKQKGSGFYHVFDVHNENKVRAEYQVVGQVKRALDQGDLELYYQPKVSLRDGAVVGFEALLRWNDPYVGQVPPLDFLPLIEQHDVICEIGEWAITSAVRQISNWSALGCNWSISVNIAARHFSNRNFIERLRKIITQEENIQSGLLDIEIVESTALENIEYVGKCIAACQGLGVTFSIDDFGTGYSSLNYLKRLPTQSLKIDQSFIREMLISDEDLAITEAIIGLSSAFNRIVVAEGVESEDHCVALKKLGCDLVQGYFISKPMPADQVLAWEKKYSESVTRKKILQYSS